jgi:hypothetical protein
MKALTMVYSLARPNYPLHGIYYAALLMLRARLSYQSAESSAEENKPAVSSEAGGQGYLRLALYEDLGAPLAHSFLNAVS